MGALSSNVDTRETLLWAQFAITKEVCILNLDYKTSVVETKQVSIVF